MHNQIQLSNKRAYLPAERYPLNVDGNGATGLSHGACSKPQRKRRPPPPPSLEILPVPALHSLSLPFFLRNIRPH